MTCAASSSASVLTALDATGVLRSERRQDAHRQRRRASLLHEPDQLVEVVPLVPCDPSGQRPWESALLELELSPVHHCQSASLPRWHLRLPPSARYDALCRIRAPLGEMTYHLPPLRFCP